MPELTAKQRGGALDPPSRVGPGESIASTDATTLHWILRVAVAACFIGHGAFGIITKAAWLPYFSIFEIPEAWAWRLVRAVILSMTFWGLGMQNPP